MYPASTAGSAKRAGALLRPAAFAVGPQKGSGGRAGEFSKKLILHRVLTHASRRALHVLAHRPRKEEISHEGLVSYRSAVRSRGPRHHPGVRAGNTARCGVERRSSASRHVPACPCDGASGGAARVPARATGCPPRLLLILFERQRRYYSYFGERLLEGPAIGRARADFGGRFDPAEWRTAAEQSDHGNERWLARAPRAATRPPRRGVI